MIANLNDLSFKSSSFADIICREKSLNNLKDGTLYVYTKNQPEWKAMVQSVQNNVVSGKTKVLWHLPYYIEAMDDLSAISEDELLMSHLEYDANFLMPLYTPDRDYKCYFIGNISDPSELEFIFAILTLDAQIINDECTFASFANTIEINPESAKQLWFKLLDYNSHLLVRGYNISFKGKYNTATSDFTFFGKEFQKSLQIPSKVNYEEFLKTVKAFPDTIASLSKNNDGEIYKEHKMNYVKICNGLSNLEKNELILELSKRINDRKILEEAINAVVNKGKLSRLKVTLIPKKDLKTAGYDGRITGDWCTCLVNENGDTRWLNFEPTAHVIYIMNLIHRLKNPNDLSTINVRQKEQEFLDIYDIIYSDAYDEDDKSNGQRLYNKLICSEDNKLKSCYKIITNCVNEHCSYFNESPAPYITDVYKPLTIDSKLIEIPETFKLCLKSYFM